MTNRIRRLTDRNRAALFEHFSRLSREDVRLRFGSNRSTESLSEYVEVIDFDQDAVFGVFQDFDDGAALIGVAHVGAMPGNTAELGISVLPHHRGSGIGTALVQRSATYARNRMINALLMHCLTENEAMMHIARKAGMTIVTDSGSSHGWLELPRGSAIGAAHEATAHCWTQ